MGQKLDCSGSLTNDAVVNVKSKAGETFTGKLVEHKITKSQYKNADGSEKNFDIYVFEVVDGTMEFVRKDANKEYMPTDVKEGENVSVFAPSRLHAGLKQAKIGQTIKITYLGLGKKGAKGGNKPHTYECEVIE